MGGVAQICGVPSLLFFRVTFNRELGFESMSPRLRARAVVGGRPIHQAGPTTTADRNTAPIPSGASAEKRLPSSRPGPGRTVPIPTMRVLHGPSQNNEDFVGNRSRCEPTMSSPYENPLCGTDDLSTARWFSRGSRANCPQSLPEAAVPAHWSCDLVPIEVRPRKSHCAWRCRRGTGSSWANSVRLDAWRRYFPSRLLPLSFSTSQGSRLNG